MADTEPLVWTAPVEALFQRALRGRLTPTLIERVRAAGIDLEKPLLPAYPWAAWIASLDATAEELYPGHSHAQAYEELGRLTIARYEETLVGKALFAALRLLSPQRVLGRLARSFRTSNNFTETYVVPLGPGRAEIRFNRVEPDPAFTLGVLAAGLPAAGVPAAKVTLHAREGESAIFLLEWNERES
jgi:uncharacterized protein (TIGR02265 family)